MSRRSFTEFFGETGPTAANYFVHCEFPPHYKRARMDEMDEGDCDGGNSGDDGEAGPSSMPFRNPNLGFNVGNDSSTSTTSQILTEYGQIEPSQIEVTSAHQTISTIGNDDRSVDGENVDYVGVRQRPAAAGWLSYTEWSSMRSEYENYDYNGWGDPTTLYERLGIEFESTGPGSLDVAVETNSTTGLGEVLLTPPNSVHGGMSMEEDVYDPALSRQENPFYYDLNKTLYELHNDRLRRAGLPNPYNSQ